MTVRMLQGDCREILRTLPDESVDCVVTSPPYWGLRDYGVEGQLGLEDSMFGFVAAMTAIFDDVRRVLKSTGTLWLNLGDSYAGGGNYRGLNSENTLATKQASNRGARGISQKLGALGKETGLEPKNLCGIPWRVAFALQESGWWLRQDIIWSKPNPMPESVTDRCTKAHEYLFLLSKSERYYFDAEAIAEPATADRPDMAEKGVRTGLAYLQQGPLASNSVKLHGNRSARDSFKRKNSKRSQPIPGQTVGTHRADRDESSWDTATRNKRSVWEIATAPFPEAHFATFPPALIEPCILAGCPKGGTVLDPFGGAGTTGLVADRLGRNAILIELNPAYVEMAKRRIEGDAGLFASITA